MPRSAPSSRKNPDRCTGPPDQSCGGAKAPPPRPSRLPPAGRRCRRTAFEIFSRVDAMMVPTVPAPIRQAQVEADPISSSSNLGTYTDFVNLLDLCGLARADLALRPTARPYGVTFLARSGRDATPREPRPRGACADRIAARRARRSSRYLTPLSPILRAGEIAIAVVRRASAPGCR